MREQFRKRLTEAAGEKNVKAGEPMANHTTFRIGGPADLFAVPADKAQLKKIAELCREEEVPFYILGKGSNLLISDNGWRGVMISTENLCGCEIQDTVMTAGAGISLAKMARAACDKGLTGFEFAAGIPGTLGGAVVMNAGAYGSEMKDVLTSATVLTPDGQVRRLGLEELKLGYRTSCIPDMGYIVLEAELRLAHGQKDEIQARMDDLAFKRRSKQPLEYPSAGSMFKRPEGYFAGKLIEDAGLRGFAVGGAQVSEKHCGFVINKGGATADDVLELCEEVSRIVQEKFGVELEREVKYLGGNQ